MGDCSVPPSETCRGNRFLRLGILTQTLLAVAAIVPGDAGYAGDHVHIGPRPGYLKEQPCRTAEPPVELLFTVTNAPATGGQVDFVLNITPEADIDELALDFSTSGVVTLTADLDQTLTALDAGVTVQIPGTLQITGTGDGFVAVDVGIAGMTLCTTLAEFSTGITLHVIDDGSTVYTGMGSLLNLRLARVQDLLSSGAITPDEAEAMTDALLTTVVDPFGGRRATRTRGAFNVVIEGVAEWTDLSGGIHPCRRVEVVVLWQLAAGVTPLVAAVQIADENGAFSFDIDPALIGPEGRNLIVRVYARNAATDVVNNLAPSGTDNIYRMAATFDAVQNGDAFTGLTFTAGTTSTVDRAFSIADSMLVGRDYMAIVDGAPLPHVDSEYPRTDGATISSYDGSQMRISVRRPYAWDVLLHEYGHYITSTFNMANSPGGRHGCRDILTDPVTHHGKDPGTRLAWGEGIATYLALAAQAVTDASTLGVPFVGDTSYHSVNSNGSVDFIMPAESLSNCFGPTEGNETAVTRCLWDVADPIGNSGVEINDAVEQGHQAIWDTLRSAAAGSGLQRLDDAYDAITNGLPTASRLLIGRIFELNRVSASLVRPAAGAAIPPDPPAFEWDGRTLDEYEVLIFDQNFNEIFATGALGNTNGWTPSAVEWADITTNGGGLIFWTVAGASEGMPAFLTGPYLSGPRRMGNGGDVDVALVIDDSGSMVEEIDAMKSALLTEITAANYPTGTVFQLTTFRESVSVRGATSNLSTIRSQINLISIGNGAPCGEVSVTGLIAGTDRLVAEGEVFFATDEPPVAGEDLPGAIDILRARGARVNVLLSGNGSCTTRGGCALGDGPGEDRSTEPICTGDETARGSAPNAVELYTQLAEATGGIFAYELGEGPLYRDTVRNIMRKSRGIAVVSDCLPSKVRRATTARLTLKGKNASFDEGSAISFSGSGLVVQEVEVADGSTLRVLVTVDRDAPTGLRTVTVTTPLGNGTEESAVGIGLIEILDTPTFPSITSVVPPIVNAGETVDIEIRGSLTSWSSESVLLFGNGIITNSLEAVCSNVIRANITVPTTVYPGFGTSTVQTGDEYATMTWFDVFRTDAVSAEELNPVTVDPGRAGPGETLTVAVAIEAAGISPEGVAVDFGNGIEVLSAEYCDDSTVTATIAVQPQAALGRRDVTVTTQTETFSGPRAFIVIGGGIDCNSNGQSDAVDVSSGASLDCNSNGIPDECDLLANRASDCNSNGSPDACDIAAGFSDDCNCNSIPDECLAEWIPPSDCNTNGIIDFCELFAGTSPDCNVNDVLDECDVSSGTSSDCDANIIPDECEPDCNANGATDACDIAAGTSFDCNTNGLPDDCEVDCNGNRYADECDIAAGTSGDCNTNAVPDECDLGSRIVLYGVHSGSDLYLISPTNGARTFIADMDQGVSSASALAADPLSRNLFAAVSINTGFGSRGYLAIVDRDTAAVQAVGELEQPIQDLAFHDNGTLYGVGSSSADVPGEIFTINRINADLNTTGLVGTSGFGQSIALRPGTDLLYYAAGTTLQVIDLSSSQITTVATNMPVSNPGTLAFDLAGERLLAYALTTLWSLDPATGQGFSLGNSGVQIRGLAADSVSADCNGNLVPDECDVLVGVVADCNGNTIPDSCEPDCNANGVADECDLAGGTSADMNDSRIPDECEFFDCNGNGVNDAADIAALTSMDCNSDSVPDECQLTQAPVLHGVSRDNPAIHAINPMTGSLTPVVGLDPIVTRTHGMSVDPVSTRMYVVAELSGGRGGASERHLIAVEPDDGTVVVIGSLAQPLADIAFRSDGALYGIAGNAATNQGEVFLIDTEDGSLTSTGIIRGWGNGQAIAFQPGTDLLFHLYGAGFRGNNGLLETIDVDSGVVTTVNSSVWPRGFTGMAFTSDGETILGFDFGSFWEMDPDDGTTLQISSGSTTITGMAYLTPSADCNANGVPDDCDIAAGTDSDCNGNLLPDGCELSGSDCNSNGVLDECDVAGGFSTDCNTNAIPDECELNAPPEFVMFAVEGFDTQLSTVDLGTADLTPAGNLMPDIDGALGLSTDPLTGDLYAIVQLTSGGPRRLATVQPSDGTATIIGSLSETLSDIAFRSDGTLYGIGGNASSAPGEIYIIDIGDASLTSTGINRGSGGGQSIAFQPGSDLLFHQYSVPVRGGGTVGQLESIDVDTGVVTIINGQTTFFELNAMTFSPDGGTLYAFEFGELYTADPVDGSATFVGSNFQTVTGIAFRATPRDCNANGILDECDIASGMSTDCNGDAVPDDCQLADNDCNSNGLPDECEPMDDCNSNGVADVCDVAAGTGDDCDGNGVLDECDIAASLQREAMDSCDESEAICPGVAYVGSTAGATPDGLASCAAAQGCSDLWYVYEPADDGLATVSLCGSDFDTAISIHASCPGGIGNELACNDDSATCGPQSEVTFSVTGGLEYWIRIAGAELPAAVIPIGQMLTTGEVMVTVPAYDIGTPASMFDGNFNSLMRTQSINPAVVTLEFSAPQATASARSKFSHPEHTWTLEAADTLADLDSQSGSWVRVFEPILEPGETINAVSWAGSPVVRRFYRFTVTRTAGDDYVHIYELELSTPDGFLCAAGDFVLNVSGPVCRNAGATLDCNGNGALDSCDIASGFSEDVNGDGVPDECVPLGDCDGDGDVDLVDFETFAPCVIGPEIQTGPGCECADLDGDGDGDLADFAVLQATLGGP